MHREVGDGSKARHPLVGRLVAERYRIISQLGEGGMADVFLARHVVIDRLSAIKFLKAELGRDPSYRDRFLREARAVNRVNHPNIVEINDFGEFEGLLYLVMEYVPGEPLSALLDRGPIGWERAASVGLRVASALARAHQMGVIHRDLKPSNLLVVRRKDGRDMVKLTDFGVAKLADARTLTDRRVAFGTPGYVAPEYRDYGVLDPRSDLYALGVVLYEATSGARPEGSGGAATGTLPLARRVPDVPEAFARVVSLLLARDPDDRPRDAFETFELLRGALATRSGDAPRAEGPRAAGPPAAPGRAPAASSPDLSAAGPEAARPRLLTVAFDRIAPFLGAALERLERLEAEGPRGAASPGAELAEARRLVRMVRDLSGLAASDASAVDAAEQRASALRQDLGARLDDLARECSKALGWAKAIEERREVVRAARGSGAVSLPTMEAMAWEQAALEVEEERARGQASELGYRMAAVQAEIARENERLERELLVLRAKLEGHVAALRAVALETHGALEAAAERIGMSKEAFLS